MLGKDVKEVLVDNSVIMRPVYLRGKVVSSVSGKTVNEATVWLKRNPFRVHHAVEDGEFEVFGRDVALYEQTDDALLITAPHYKPIISTDSSIPVVRIPSGVFRMGQGLFLLWVVLLQSIRFNSLRFQLVNLKPQLLNGVSFKNGQRKMVILIFQKEVLEHQAVKI